MAFIDIVLEPPRYGWQDENGNLIKPTNKQIFSEFLYRINIFRTRKNWMSFFGWFTVLCLAPFFVLYWVKYFTWETLIIGFLYGMVVMGTHGTVWYHRYGTHRAFAFKNKFWRFITRNLVIKVIPEEMYIVSHHIHHSKSDQPGDPYNANCGFLYCFLADTNHQAIAKNLSKEDYLKAASLVEHTGVKANTYEQYQKWSTIAHPVNTIVPIFLNWAFWYGVFYLIGGHALAVTLFGWTGVWAVGIRTFNYEGHGKGKDKRREGVDFCRDDMSINQAWPGYVAGEWHNNHHLYPRSARAGFQPHQIDLAWCYVYLLHLIGGVESYNNSKPDFYEKHYIPYLKNKKSAPQPKPKQVEEAA